MHTPCSTLGLGLCSLCVFVSFAFLLLSPRRTTPPLLPLVASALCVCVCAFAVVFPSYHVIGCLWRAANEHHSHPWRRRQGAQSALQP